MTWPVSLPQSPLAGSFNVEYPDNVIATQMSSGASKRRLRDTAMPVTVSLTFRMNSVEFAAFDDWFKNTNKFGVNKFMWQSPLESTPSTYRIAGKPSVSVAGGTRGSLRDVAMVWEWFYWL